MGDTNTITSNNFSLTNCSSYYKKDDKEILIDELNKYGIKASKITNNLKNFASFVDYMISKPLLTPKKLGIYIKKIMKYDDGINTRSYYPHVTHAKKLGDCNDAAILGHYILEKAGYTKKIKDELPLPAQFYNYDTKKVKEESSLLNSDFQFPLYVEISKDPESTPLLEGKYHAVCIYADKKTGLLNILETRKGLTETKCKTLIDLVDKFEPTWKRIYINIVVKGDIDNNSPVIYIKRSDVKSNPKNK